MKAVRLPGGPVGGVVPYPLPQSTVQRVPNPGRTVVSIVVIMIEAILGPFVPLEKLLKLLLGTPGHLQLLDPDRPVGATIRLYVGLRRKPLHPVPHSSLEKPDQKFFLPQVEQAIVIGLIGAPYRVMDQDRIVAEALPDSLTGSHGHKVDGQVGAIGGLVIGWLNLGALSRSDASKQHEAGKRQCR